MENPSIVGPMSSTLIIVPTYNERENIKPVVEAFLKPLENASILFVDDGSPDGTGEVIDAIVAENSRVHVIHRAGKLGLGTAYLEGFQWGLSEGYDYILEMDADFSHDPKYLPDLVGLCVDGADMAIGSRYVKGGGSLNWGVGRQILSRAGGIYARTVLGMKVQDMTSGFACYRRKTLEQIDLKDVRSNGYSFQIEMKYRVAKKGMHIAELPIIFQDREVGESKMSKAIFAEALVMVARLRARRL